MCFHKDVIIGSAKPMNIVLANYSKWCLSQRVGYIECFVYIHIYIMTYICVHKNKALVILAICNCLGLSNL